MGSQKFINPDNKKQSVEIEECKLDKKLKDFDSRNNRVPEVDEFYVDLGMQYRLAQVMNSKSKSFKNEIPIHIALMGHMGTGKDHDIEQFAAKLRLSLIHI